MFFRKLGTSDLQVSSVGLGTWAIGSDYWGPVDDKQSIAGIHAAIDHGINLIDTAPAYGAGHAERIVGEAVKGRRDKVIIATKVGVTRTADDFVVNLSPDSITKEIEDSLRNLNVDTIDLYQIHWPDPNIPLEKSLHALDKLKAQGKYRYLGVSNFSPEQIAAAKRITEVVSCQPQYSLLRRDIEKKMVPYCIDNNIGLITYGTLAGGILTGKYKEIPRFDEGDHRNEFYDFFHEPIWSRIQVLLDHIRPAAAAHDKTLAQAVINWSLWQPGISSVLVGARNPRQAVENAEAADWELSNDELDLLAEESAQHLQAVQTR